VIYNIQLHIFSYFILSINLKPMLMMLRFVVVQQATPALKEETNGQGQNTKES
jgi:hypothetical protein